MSCRRRNLRVLPPIGLLFALALCAAVASSACAGDDASKDAQTPRPDTRQKDQATDLPISDTLPAPDLAIDLPPPDATVDLPPPDATVDLPPGPSAKINVSVDTTNVTCGTTAGDDCVGLLVIRLEDTQTGTQIALKELPNSDLRGATIIAHTFYTLPLNTQISAGAALFETSPTPTPTQPDVGDLITNSPVSFTLAAATDAKTIDLLLDLRCSAGAGTSTGAPPLSLLLLALGVIASRRRGRCHRG